MADAAVVQDTATGGDNGGNNAGGTGTGAAAAAGNAATGGSSTGNGSQTGAGGTGSGAGAAASGGPAAGATKTDAAGGVSDATGAAAAAQSATDPNAAKVADVWGDKWRETYAGDDKAKLNVLGRYASAKDALDAFIELKNAVAKGELRRPAAAPGKDAKPEEVAAYRKANGVPATPDEYLKALPEGLVLGEVDKDVMSGFLKDMHDQNAPPAYVAKALENYVKAQGIFQQKLERQDLETLKATNNALRAEWQGSDYDTNVTHVKALIEANFPSDVQEIFMNGRLGDEKTTPILAHPGVIKALANLGRTLNPTGTVTGGAGIDNVDTLNSQIKGYEDRMAGRGPDGKFSDHTRQEWYKDEKAQSHLRTLYDARDRLQAGRK